MKVPHYHMLTPAELLLVILASSLLGGCAVALSAFAYVSTQGCAVEADEPAPVRPVMTTHEASA